MSGGDAAALERELRALAALIDAPAKLLPAVGREPRDEGYWLSIEGASRDALIDGLKRHGHRHVLPLSGPTALPALIAAEAKEGDLVVCLGAGDITVWAQALPAQLEALAA